MPLYTEDTVAPAYGLADLQFSTGDVLAAQREETFLDLPLLSAIPRSSELSAARRFGGLTTPQYDKAGALAWLGAKGLTETDLPLDDRRYNERELSILANRKVAEIRRRQVLDGGEGGFAQGAARFGNALAISLLDPLNIASGFVPVISGARYAAAVAGAGGAVGRAATRASIGVVEGATGAALLEPLIYGARAQELADYSIADSLINVAFGGVFGGGLHSVGGALGDRLGISGYAQQAARLSRLETSLAKIGDVPDVPRLATDGAGPVAAPRFDVEGEIARRYDIRVAQLQAAADAPPTSNIGAVVAESPQRLANRELSSLIRDWPELSRVERAERLGGSDQKMLMREAADLDIEDMATEIETTIADIRTRLPEAEARRDALQAQADELAARSSPGAEGLLVAQRITEDLRAARSEVNGLRGLAGQAEQRVKELRNGLSADGSARRAMQAGPAARAQAFKAAIAQAATDQPITVEPAFRPDRATFETAAARLSDPAQRPGVDANAARAVDEQLAEAPTVEDTALADEVAGMLDDGDAVAADLKLAGIDEPEAAARYLESVREMAEDAERMSKISRLAVVCSLRSA